VIIASAAAFPAAIPSVLASPSGIALSEASYAAFKDSCKAVLFGNGMDGGTVWTMFERTLYPAVATAASFEAVGLNCVVRRYA
jgi:hypothetical protein